MRPERYFYHMELSNIRKKYAEIYIESNTFVNIIVKGR